MSVYPYLSFDAITPKLCLDLWLNPVIFSTYTLKTHFPSYIEMINLSLALIGFDPYNFSISAMMASSDNYFSEPFSNSISGWGFT